MDDGTDLVERNHTRSAVDADREHGVASIHAAQRRRCRTGNHAGDVVQQNRQAGGRIDQAAVGAVDRADRIAGRSWAIGAIASVEDDREVTAVVGPQDRFVDMERRKRDVGAVHFG